MIQIQLVDQILATAKTIAVVGLSTEVTRPSNEVAAYLQVQGYRIVPVNPRYSGTDILGELCYADLTHAAQALRVQGISIDVIDCFRRAEDMASIAVEAANTGAKTLWMQLGVVNQTAADIATQAKLDVVMDRCMKIEHQRWSTAKG